MNNLSNCLNLENYINYEGSEYFPNSGFMTLIFPIRKDLGPLPKIAKKISDDVLTFLVWGQITLSPRLGVVEIVTQGISATIY